MASNPNPQLPNNHHLYAATSGGGKSQALAQNLNAMTDGSSRVLLWDTHQDFKADRYDKIQDFILAVARAEKKGGGFRIAYTGPGKLSAFKYFCKLVWSIADGRKITHVGIDELADVTGGPGKDRGPLGELLRGGRKFGLVLHCSATRAAEIPKTVFTQCQHKFIGVQDSMSDAKNMADLLFIKPDQLLNLKPLEFYKKQGQQGAVKVAFKYKKPPI